MDDEAPLQSVLRCGLCNKPFDKESTLKRHGYYCRSRRTGPKKRPRSCISCTRRKARCDNRRPGCSRCLKQGVECHYPVPAPRTRETGAPSLGAGLPPGTGSSQEVSCHDDKVLDTALAISDPATVPDLDPGVANLGLPEVGEYIDWDNYDPDQMLDFSDFDFPNSVPWTNEKTAQYQYQYQYPLPSSHTDTLHHSTPSPPSSSSSSPNIQIQTQKPLPSPKISIPLLPTLPRLLIHRPKSTTGGKRTTALILHTLKSYLLMMLRENTVPPFIHSRTVPLPVSPSPSSSSSSSPWSSTVEAEAEAQNTLSYNPLANCITLVQTLSTPFPKKSRKSFWENVRIECERLLSSEYQDQRKKIGRWELVGAMQALSVYILIRLDEGETEENNLDFLLLAAVTVIAKQLSSGDSSDNSDMHFSPYYENLEASWKAWMFEESRRRLSIIYRILNMLVYFEPAAKCELPTDLILAPLPAKKLLWEATDAAVWKAEILREPGAHQMGFGLAATGELVRLDKRGIRRQGTLYPDRGDAVLLHTALDAASVSRSAVGWEEWCSGMDEFGGIVMLAASLVL